MCPSFILADEKWQGRQGTVLMRDDQDELCGGFILLLSSAAVNRVH